MKNLLIAFAFLFSSGCAVTVNSLYDHNVAFENYDSFCWLEGCEFTYTGPSYLDDSALRENIKSSIIQNLTSKGLHQNTEDPDLLIDFHISVENEAITVYHDEDDIFYGNLDQNQKPEHIEYLKGTLIIDIVDKKEGRMIWRSAAISYMDINPQLTHKNIQKGIARALKDFPPKPSE